MSAQPASLLQRHRLDITDYYRMAEAGILGEDDRCELIKGEIIDRAPMGSVHASSVQRQPPVPAFQQKRERTGYRLHT